MPAERSVTSTSRRGEKGRHVEHVSRACDGCRKRKAKCDGKTPKCTACTERHNPCEYNDEDRRKTHAEKMAEITSRLQQYDSIFLSLQQGEGLRAALPQSVATAHTGAPGLPMPVLPTASRGVLAQNMDGMATTDYAPFPYPPSDGIQWHPSAAAMHATSSSGVPVGATLHRSFPAAADSHTQFSTRSIEQRRQENIYRASIGQRQTPADSSLFRKLPSSLGIDRATHDKALGYFEAFYGPWSLIDVPAVMADLRQGDHTDGATKDSGTGMMSRHAPALHCCILFLGLQYIREEEPELLRRFEAVFVQHCYPLLLLDRGRPSLSSLVGLNLLASSVDCQRPFGTTLEDLQEGIVRTRVGALHLGTAIGAIHVLGLNDVSSDDPEREDLTQTERHVRDDAFWTTFLHDALRALADARPPMLRGPVHVALPSVNKNMDDKPWVGPGVPVSMSGARSMSSSTFHWTVRLAVIANAMLVGAPLSKTDDKFSQQLDQWYAQFPLRPAEEHALPHVLTLHCIYHSCVIHAARSRPVSGDKVHRSAVRILHLVRIIDSTYGLRFGHHHLVSPIRHAAGVFILSAAGMSPHAVERAPDRERLDELLNDLLQLGKVWQEANSVREELLSMCSEYSL